MLSILSLLSDVEDVRESHFESFYRIINRVEGARVGRAFVDTVAIQMLTDIVVVKILDDVLDILSLCGGQCDFGVVLYFHNFYFPFL